MSKFIVLYLVIGLYCMWLEWYERCRFMQKKKNGSLRNQIITERWHAVSKLKRTSDEVKDEIMCFVAKHWKLLYVNDRVWNVLLWPFNIGNSLDTVLNILWDIRELLFG